MQLKSQDVLVALKLVACGERRWTYAGLAQELGLSASEIHASVKRGVLAGLLVDKASLSLPDGVLMGASEPAALYRVHVRPRRTRVVSASDRAAAPLPADNPVQVHARNLAEFIVHGAKFAFPAQRLPTALGIPTSHSAPAFKNVFAPGADDWVWPYPYGTVRGQGLAPLHASAPFAALQDAKLYDMLALLDALRVGRARERTMAIERLPRIIHPEGERVARRGARG